MRKFGILSFTACLFVCNSASNCCKSQFTRRQFCRCHLVVASLGERRDRCLAARPGPPRPVLVVDGGVRPGAVVFRGGTAWNLGAPSPAVPSEETQRHLTFWAATGEQPGAPAMQRQNRSTSPKLLLFSSAHILPPSPPSPPAQSLLATRVSLIASAVICDRSHASILPSPILHIPGAPPNLACRAPSRPPTLGTTTGRWQRAASSSLPPSSQQDWTSFSSLTASSCLAAAPPIAASLWHRSLLFVAQARGRRTKSALPPATLDGVALLS